MDKMKVITAYQRGFITLRECEQILGMDASFILSLAHDRHRVEGVSVQPPANQGRQVMG